jgi:hypothetical protein
MDVQLDIAEHVRSSVGQDGTVLLDLRSGKYFALNAVGSLLWAALVEDACRSAALDRLAARFPQVPAERLERDADALIDQLRAKGLLRLRTAAGRESGPAAPAVAASTPIQPSTPASSRPAAAEAGGAGLDSRAGALWVPVAYLALLASDFVLKVLGFARFHGLVRRIPTRTRTHLGPARAQRIVRSVDRASAFYFKRAWCLQRSAVTVALLRLCGLPARLVIGARRVPFFAHAWVELDGRVVNDRPEVRQTYEVLETC